METAILLVGILLLLFLIGSVLGCIAFFRIDKLSQENNRLHRELVGLSSKLNRYIASAVKLPNHGDQEETSSDTREPDSLNNSVSDNIGTISKDNKNANSVEDEIVDLKSPASVPNNAFSDNLVSSKTHPLIENIKSNWMIWVGGISIGLAGIFLVKYSIDNGLLGPTARIVLAFLTGIAFHIAAYYFHLKKGQNDIFAALAGGASLVLYAACLAALHLYQLFTPGWAFIILAMISIATMLLALVQGPVLAALGILGAYLVPIFVSTGSNNVTAALIYSFIVSCSALLLIRFVKRDWLWIGTLVGAGFWWLVSLTVVSTEISRLLYLLALTYAVLAIECWDWRLRKALVDQDLIPSHSLYDLLKQGVAKYQKKVSITLLVLMFAWLLSLILVSLNSTVITILALFSVLTLYVAYHQRMLIYIAWLGFVITILGLLLQGINIHSAYALNTLSAEIDKLLLTLIILLSVIYASFSFFALQKSHYKGYWSSLGLLAPLILIALGYMRVDSMQSDWHWAMIAAGLGAVYFHLLYRKKRELSPTAMVAIIFSGHVAYTLAVVILFQAATLTLALAVQVASLAWLDRYFRLPILPLLIKIILAVVIARLTLNPWLLTYPADVHWSLWTYGGSFLFCVLAAYFVQKGLESDNAQARAPLLNWLKAASAHLLVLAIIAETRYQLYDGNIFAQQYSFLEAAINTGVWGILGLVYMLRMQVAETLAFVYRWIAHILILAAFANYVIFLLLFKNPLFSSIELSATPIFNVLLLAYGLPCLIGLFVLCFQKDKVIRRIAGGIVAVMLLIFVSIEIRHLWHGQLNFYQATFAGEIYTYSMVWLVMAIAGSLIGIKIKSRDFYRGSMLFLLLVVAKIFLIDTSGLSSLWRVAAFMGLGISLLGLAYLHQKMQVVTEHSSTA